MAENYWDKLMGTDEGAANYMESYGEGPGCETRLVVGSFINDGESVLDVGCGPGWNFDHFKHYGPIIWDYKGLDYSERFVRVANQRVKKVWGLDNLYEVGDARDLKEADGSWDVVILQDILEHTNGYEKPIQEALRVADKRVIVTFWRMHEGQQEDKINVDGNDGFGADYSPDGFRKYLDSLDLHWMETETSPKANRWHIFFVIDKEVPHGNPA